MGVGKSSVGRAVAQRLGVPFCDLDEQIGDVVRIFAEEGEPGFRRREHQALLHAARGRGVLALGGGTVVSAANREALAPWTVVVLMASTEVLRQRLGAGEGRPLAGEFEARLNERRPIYATFGPPVATDTGSFDDVVNEVIGRCQT
jgi:shikimate kinase